MVIGFTRLTPVEIRAELDAVGREAAALFGALDASQLNWQPDATRWSVAQCLEHLLLANAQMLTSMERALDSRQPRTIWQRLPLWSTLFGLLLIKSQAPHARRRYTADPRATPAASAVAADVVARFVADQRHGIARLSALRPHDLGRVMVSPFLSAVTYSVLDGWRLMVTHDRRHLEQARRVTSAPGFPAAARTLP